MENNFVKEMLPYKLQQLLEAIIEEKKLTVNDAIQYLYSSDLYKQMSLDDSYLWQLSKANLYDMLQTEKSEKRQKEDNSGDILLFLSFCIENYKEHKNLSAEEVLFLFNKYGVLDFLSDVYDTLHTQGEAYIMDDIDEYIDNRKEPNETTIAAINEARSGVSAGTIDISSMEAFIKSCEK